MAKRILQFAREHKIPIRQNKDLIQVLSRLVLDQEVPTYTCQVGAEILAFVYRASEKQQNA